MNNYYPLNKQGQGPNYITKLGQTVLFTKMIGTYLTYLPIEMNVQQ